MDRNSLDLIQTDINQVLPGAQVFAEIGQSAFGTAQEVVATLCQQPEVIALKSYNMHDHMSEKVLGDTIEREINGAIIDKADSSFVVVSDVKQDPTQVCKNQDDLGMDQQLHKRGKPFDETQLKVWFRSLLDGLIELERKKITHRDIRPGNLLLVNGKLVLRGFGASHGGQGATSTSFGDDIFKAPEIGQAGVIDCKTIF